MVSRKILWDIPRLPHLLEPVEKFRCGIEKTNLNANDLQTSTGYSSMKLRVGKFLIETNHIEMAERLSPHTAKLYFVSGKTLEVICGLKTTAPATWDQDADGFIQTLQNTDSAEINAAISKKK